MPDSLHRRPTSLIWGRQNDLCLSTSDLKIGVPPSRTFGANIMTVFPCVWVLIMNKRRSQDWYIFITAIPILIGWYIDTAPNSWIGLSSCEPAILYINPSPWWVYVIMEVCVETSVSVSQCVSLWVMRQKWGRSGLASSHLHVAREIVMLTFGLQTYQFLYFTERYWCLWFCCRIPSNLWYKAHRIRQ